MRIHPAVLHVWVLVAAAALISTGCEQSGRSDRLDALLEMESTAGYEGREVPEERVAELRRAIDRYSSIVEEKVDAANQLGVYYKLLGQEYLDQSMYRLSLEAFDEAIRIHPENAVLYFKAGLSAAQYGRSRVDPVERSELIDRAEAYYRRGLAIDPANPDLGYALAVLYVFELDRPADAIPLLEGLLDREPRDVSALFLVGRAYAAVGRISDAVEAYERAAESAASDEVRSRALRNASELLGSGGG